MMKWLKSKLREWLRVEAINGQSASLAERIDRLTEVHNESMLEALRDYKSLLERVDRLETLKVDVKPPTLKAGNWRAALREVDNS